MPVSEHMIREVLARMAKDSGAIRHVDPKLADAMLGAARGIGVGSGSEAGCCTRDNRLP